MRLLEDALALAEELDLTGEVWQIQVELGKCYQEAGEEDQARDSFARAARILEALATKIDDEQLRQAFLSAGPALALMKSQVRI